VANTAAKDAAQFFWTAAGQKERFPRNLETPASWGLPVAIVKLPRLWGVDIRRYLQNTGTGQLSVPDSLSLRGFMLAADGKGLLFLNGGDPPDEQRYSLAHEIAHFLLDYYLPRLRTVEILGPRICEVLDGHRHATVDERIHAVLAAAPIGMYEYRLCKIADLGSSPAIHDESEVAADELAVELLAPFNVVIKQMKGFRADDDFNAFQSRLRAKLVKLFGLPVFAADGIAAVYTGRCGRRKTFKQWLGIQK